MRSNNTQPYVKIKHNKAALARAIASLVPDDAKLFTEVMVGSGAVSLELASTRPRMRFEWYDINSWLIHHHVAVRSVVAQGEVGDAFLVTCKMLSNKYTNHQAKTFNAVARRMRTLERSGSVATAPASIGARGAMYRLINRTSATKHGAFIQASKVRATWGNRNPSRTQIVKPTKDWMEYRNAMRRVRTIIAQPYEDTVEELMDAKPQVVYFDPPKHTSNMRENDSYFIPVDSSRVADCARRLHAVGHTVIVTDSTLVSDIYKDATERVVLKANGTRVDDINSKLATDVAYVFRS